MNAACLSRADVLDQILEENATMKALLVQLEREIGRLLTSEVCPDPVVVAKLRRTLMTLRARETMR